MKNYCNNQGFTLMEALVSVFLMMVLAVIAGYGISKLKKVNVSNQTNTDLQDEFLINSIYQYYQIHPDKVEDYLKTFDYTLEVTTVETFSNGNLYSFTAYPKIKVGIVYRINNYLLVIYKANNNEFERYMSCIRIVRDTFF